MRSFMLLLALGLVASEKLDRTYLPPPGSKYSGGEPGDLQAPLEFPKEAYTTVASGQIDNGFVAPGDTPFKTGTIRGPVLGVPGSKDFIPSTPASLPPFSNLQNTFKVPSTTTSYAFTQTTTFPPPEGLPGLPNVSPFEYADFGNQPFNQDQLIFNQQPNQIRPGLSQPTFSIPQGPGFITSSLNDSSIPSFVPGNQFIASRPGNIPGQNINQYQPGFSTTTLPPIFGSTVQPGVLNPGLANQGYTEHLGVQPPSEIYQQGSFQTSTTSPAYQSNYLSKETVGPQQSTTQYVDEYGNMLDAGAPGLATFQQAGNYNTQVGNQQRYLPKPGRNQYGEDVRPIPNTPSTQRGNQVTQETGLPNIGSQGTLLGSTIQNQGPYQTPVGPQRSQNRQFTQVSSSSTASPQGELTIQENQLPNGISQGAGTVSSVIQSQRDQRPQSGGQQTYQPTGFSQGSYTLQPGYQQTENRGHEDLSLSSIAPQTTLRPDPGNSQISQGGGQFSSYPNTIQGSSIPTQLPSYQPNGQQQQFGGQQIPISTSGLTLPTYQQTGALVPQLTSPQASPTGIRTPPSKYQQENKDSGQDRLRPGFSAAQSLFSGQGKISTEPGSQPNLSQFSETEDRVPSQQNAVTEKNQNIFKPRPTGSSSTATGNRQPFYPSTTPSLYPTSFDSSTANPSSTPLYPGSISEAGTLVTVNTRPQRPQAESDRNAVILNYENVLTPEGFAYSFDTSNGIHADETGTAIDGVRANGSYSYIGDDGKLYSVVYTADENGFQPHGDHLPTPPPVPEAIQRVIEQAARDRETGISHDGFYDADKYGHEKYQQPAKHRSPQNQNSIINGADIPDDDKSSINHLGNKKTTFMGAKKPELINGQFTDDVQYSDDNRQISNGKTGKNKSENNEKYLKGKVPSRQPTTDRPGLLEYDQNYENSSEEINDKMTGGFINDYKQKPVLSGKKSSRPTSIAQKGKPKNQYEDSDSNVNDATEETEEYETVSKPGSFDKNRKYLPMPKGTGYSGTKDSSQRKDVLDGLDAKEQVVTKRPKGDKRITTSTTISDEYTSDTEPLRQTYTTRNKPPKPGQNNTKIYGPKYSSNRNQDRQFPVVNLKGSEMTDIVSSPYDKRQRQKERPQSYSQDGTFETSYDFEVSGYQNKSKPPSGQREMIYKEKHPQEALDEEAGYQYTPPQNKFYQGDIYMFPTRFSEKISTTMSPINSEFYNRKTTIQPFITPNVHHNDDESYEESSEDDKLSSIDKYKDNINESDFNIGDDDNIPVRLRPGKISITSSNRRPEYATKSTTENYDEDSAEEVFENTQPLLKISRQKPGTSPYQRPGYQTSQTTEKQQYFDGYTRDDENVRDDSSSTRQEEKGTTTDQGNYRQPTIQFPKTGYVLSTTPTPFGKPYRPSVQQPESSFEPDASTTYNLSDTLSTKEDYSEDTSTPGTFTTDAVTRRLYTPSYSSNSTTSSSIRKSGPSSISSLRPAARPNNEYPERGSAVPGSPFIKPGVSESTFRRPSVGSTSVETSEFTPATFLENTTELGSFATEPSNDSIDLNDNENKPGSDKFSNVATRPERPNYPASIPGLIPKRPGSGSTQTLPSTTYRPNYSITDITPPSTVNNDYFRMPMQSTEGTGTELHSRISGPGYTVSEQEVYSTGLPSDYQNPVPTPGKIDINKFKPNESRFGGPTKGTIGPKPAEFGPSSVVTPGYLEPHESSNKRVFGEDFSGPKQQQKYDPKSGYYY